jgi:hypothetical protein
MRTGWVTSSITTARHLPWDGNREWYVGRFFLSYMGPHLGAITFCGGFFEIVMQEIMIVIPLFL